MIGSAAVDAEPVDGWPIVVLGDICRTTSGGTPSRKRLDYFNGSIPWVKSGELPDGLVSEVEESITDEALLGSSAKLFPAGTLLIAMYGATVGKLGLLAREAATNQAVCAIFPPPALDTKFLFWYLRHRRSYLVAQAIGGAQPNISQTIIRDLLLPVPPLDAQREIVAEIEKQFSRLDESVANLKRVKVNLRRYESATLRAAFEGRLVESEAAMAACESRQFESGEQLLRRIADARPKASGRRKDFDPYRSLQELADLPSIPEGWAWARLDCVAAIKGGITVDAKRVDPSARRVPYLRVANVQRGYLDLSEVKEINAPEGDIRELRLENGDLLFNEGGDRDKLGRGWVWDDQLPECIHQNHVFRARLLLKELSPKLISWWGNTFGKQYFSRQGKQTTNLASINLGKLSAFPVPIPPVAEQHRIVAEVDRRLSIVREVEAEVEANLKRAQALRQAILAKAFSGAYA